MKKIQLLVLLWLAALLPTLACTSFLVSGRVTPDGRPLAFKNRDTGNQDNLAVIIQGSKYKFLAIVGAKDSLHNSVWSGHNEAGFAIFNTAAYNLNKPDEDGDERDGRVMRMALETCATVDEFQQMLDNMPRPLHSNSNFGVIDAKGGCAYFETGNNGYVKFDVNDPNVAPYGYLIRTNHGMSGNRAQDQGVERYMAIESIMTRHNFSDGFNCRQLLTTVPRTLKHGLTGLDLHDFMPADASERVMFPFRDFIPRYLSASTMMVQGVKAGEDPSLTIAWTIVGNPLTTPAIPLMIGVDLPAITTCADGVGSSAALCQWSMDLRNQRLFPQNRGNRTDYIDVAQLINKAGTGILQQVLPAEKEVLDKGTEVVEGFRKAGKINSKELSSYYSWVNEFLTEFYSKL